MHRRRRRLWALCRGSAPASPPHGCSPEPARAAGHRRSSGGSAATCSCAGRSRNRRHCHGCRRGQQRRGGGSGGGGACCPARGSAHRGECGNRRRCLFPRRYAVQSCAASRQMPCRRGDAHPRRPRAAHPAQPACIPPTHPHQVDARGVERLALQPEGWSCWSWRGHNVNFLAAGDKGPVVVLVHGFGASVYHW